MSTSPTESWRPTGALRRSTAAGLIPATLLVLAACAPATGTTGTSGAATSVDRSETVAVSLIVKTTTNPFFLAMQDGAEQAAVTENVELTFAAGREDGDEDTQIQAIENAISQGQAGILITPNGPAVLDAVARAREAGLYVIALDTAPDPLEAVDITFATDNRDAGVRIGIWAAAALAGEHATIALLDLFDDKVVSVDVNRDQGFLTGMGIDFADPNLNGDEAATGEYAGGTYEIVCNEAAQGTEDGGVTAMETCLAKNPDINVVYTVNEPTAYGAHQALEAAGISPDEVLLVSVDGGCAGVGYVADGIIDATSQQYPVRMAEEGLAAIAALARTGEEPATSQGLSIYSTGVELVTNQTKGAVQSIDTIDAEKICWG